MSSMSELNDLFTLLRKHKITSYDDDQVSVSLSYQHDLFRGVIEEDVPASTQPQPGAVEPSPYDIEEVLFGAK